MFIYIQKKFILYGYLNQQNTEYECQLKRTSNRTSDLSTQNQTLKPAGCPDYQCKLEYMGIHTLYRK